MVLTLSLGVLAPNGAVAQNEIEPPGEPGGPYTVALRTQPSRTLTVNVQGASGTDLAVNNAVLTFTRDNWSVPQTASVAAGADADAVYEEVPLSHSTSGTYPTGGEYEVRVTVTDDDIPSTVTAIRSDTSSVAEGGGAYAVTVTAAYDAAADTRDIPARITVDPGSAEGGRDFEGVECFVVTIPAGQTAASGVSTLELIDDREDEDDETIAINGEIVAGPVQDAYPVVGTTVTIADDDTRGIIVGAWSLTIEQGESASYEIVLTSRPTEPMEIEVVAPEGSGIVVRREPYGFGANSWDKPRTVQVRVREDAEIASGPDRLNTVRERRKSACGRDC